MDKFVVFLSLVALHYSGVCSSLVATGLSSTTRSTTAPPSIPCQKFHEYCHRNFTLVDGIRVWGKPVPQVKPQELSLEMHSFTRCFCDPDCKLFGDCCYDIVRHDVEQIQMIWNAGCPKDRDDIMDTYHRTRKWTCGVLPLTFNENLRGFQVYMIGSCPSTWKDRHISRRCDLDLPSSDYDYTLDLPVISKISHTIYANIYCAMCNEDGATLYKWDINVHCPKLIGNCTDYLNEWRYVPGLRKWSFGASNQHQVAYTLELNTGTEGTFYELFNARQCRTDVIAECPRNWTSGEEQLLCSSHAFYVKSKQDNKLYKNPYCAVCNGQPNLPRNFVCPSRSVTGHSPIVMADSGHVPNSLSMLLDFMGDDTNA